MKLKTIDRLVGISFIGPYILSFLIAEFVLVMQFLWKYIDDITGKGISLLEILELVFYFAVTIIPRSIPVTVLLASVFVFGNMAEKFELTSLKSAGVSLMRIMRMGLILAVMTSLFSIFASNVLVTKANYAFYKRFDTIRKQKPALSIEAKMFNDDFYGYKIYVDKKLKDEKTVEGVMIYDHTATDLSIANIIIAKKGIMETTPDGNYFVMNLIDGYQYRELKEKIDPKTMNQEKKYPFIRTSFKTWRKVFDMSEFDMNSENVNIMRRSYDLMNTPQLLAAIDTVKNERTSVIDQVVGNFNNILHIKNEEELKKLDSIPNNYIPKQRSKIINDRRFQQIDVEEFSKLGSFLESFQEKEKANMVSSALSLAQRYSSQIGNTHQKMYDINFRENRFVLKLHQQYSWALVCIIFLFIGAPLGSIIRKGGYGYPLLIAIVFFMVFIILMIMGEKLMRSQSLGPIMAAWLPCLALLPVAIFFSYKALIDSKLFEWDSYLKIIKYFRARITS